MELTAAYSASEDVWVEVQTRCQLSCSLALMLKFVTALLQVWFDAGSRNHAPTLAPDVSPLLNDALANVRSNMRNISDVVADSTALDAAGAWTNLDKCPVG